MTQTRRSFFALRQLPCGWQRFWQAQDGASTIPTIIFLPFLLMILFAGVELSILSIRQVMLDAGLDKTVRMLRVGVPLSADNATALEQLRKSICTNIGFIHNCKTQLMIEQYEVIRDDTFTYDADANVISVSRNWRSTGQGLAASCTDKNLLPPPTYTLDRSAPGQMVLVRACLKIDPVMPNFGIAPLFSRDENGMISLIASSAYVREPL